MSVMRFVEIPIKVQVDGKSRDEVNLYLERLKDQLYYTAQQRARMKRHNVSAFVREPEIRSIHAKSFDR